MNIGSIFLSLLADGSKLGPQVEDEAQKAGDAGAKTLGAKLGGALKTNGLKAFGAVASAAFGIAAAGALKLTDIQARFQAETGESADAAKAAAKAINATAGRERTALEDVADAAISVRRNLGVTGDEADKLTDRFVRFARVTRQGPAAAVAAFDDILDAWSIPAEKSGEIMDALVASGQKYGGVITDDQKALADLAPALKAANQNWEDGLALINLFKSSGVDAADSVAGITKALSKVKSPEELKRLTDDIIHTEDPFLRAQKAADLFGAKAGPKLANVLKPGIGSLEDFKTSGDAVTGTLDKAADALDSTPWARFQKFISEASAGLRDLGSDFGPLLTGIASLGSILGTTFSKQLFEAGKAAGGALIDGVGTVTGAAGTVFGNLIAQALDPHNPFLNGVIGKSAARLGALFSSAFTAAARLTDAVVSAVNSLPFVPAVKSGLAKAGTFMGSTMGKAMGIAAGVAFSIWLVDEINRRKDEAAAAVGDIAGNVSNEIAHGTTEQLQKSLAALKSGIDAIVAETNRNGIITLATPEQITALEGLVAQYNAVQTELNRRAQQGLDVPVTVDGAHKVLPSVDQLMNGMASHVRGGAPGVVNEVARILSLTVQQFASGAHDVRQAMANVILGAAAGIRSERGAVDSAIAQLKDDMEHKLPPKKEVAHRIGQLFSKTLVQGLHSADREVKLQAEGTRLLIIDQLVEAVRQGGKAGEEVQKELARKLKSNNPKVRQEAQDTKAAIDAALKHQPPKTPGEAITQNLANDISQGTGLVGRAAYNLGHNIAQNLLAGVNGTGVVSGGGGGGGARRRARGGPVMAGEPYIVGEHGPELFVPAEAGLVVPNVSEPGGGSAAPAGGDTFNLYLPDAQHRDPWSVLDRLPRYAKVAKAAAAESGWKAA